MLRQILSFVIVVAVLGASDEPKRVLDFTSPSATRAAKRHDDAVQRASDVYRKTLITVKRAYIKALAVAIKQAINATDLDEANALNREKKAVQAELDLLVVQDIDIKGSIKVTVIEIAQLPKEILDKKVRAKATVTASSFFDSRFRPAHAIDSDASTEFAFLGPEGEIEFNYGKGIRCRLLVYHARRSRTDHITNGKITINGRYSIRFKDFNSHTALVVKLPSKTLVTNVKISSIIGHTNPGISDSYFVP